MEYTVGQHAAVAGCEEVVIGSGRQGLHVQQGVAAAESQAQRIYSRQGMAFQPQQAVGTLGLQAQLPAAVRAKGIGQVPADLELVRTQERIGQHGCVGTGIAQHQAVVAGQCGPGKGKGFSGICCQVCAFALQEPSGLAHAAGSCGIEAQDAIGAEALRRHFVKSGSQSGQHTQGYVSGIGPTASVFQHRHQGGVAVLALGIAVQRLPPVPCEGVKRTAAGS